MEGWRGGGGEVERGRVAIAIKQPYSTGCRYGGGGSVTVLKSGAHSSAT
jgi:hypothetical protein